MVFNLKGLFHPACLARVVPWFAFVVAIFMGHENGDKQRLAKRRHVQGMLDETDPLILVKRGTNLACAELRSNNETLQQFLAVQQVKFVHIHQGKTPERQVFAHCRIATVLKFSYIVVLTKQHWKKRKKMGVKNNTPMHTLLQNENQFLENGQ